MRTCIPTQNIKGLSLLSLKVQWDGSRPPSPPPPTHISAYGMGTHNNHWRGSSTLGLHLEQKLTTHIHDPGKSKVTPLVLQHHCNYFL